VKILFITSRLPFPPYRGDKSRTYNFIKTLSKDHEITLVSFCENRSEFLHKKDLEVYCTAVYLVYLPKLFSWLKTIVLYFNRDPSQSYYYRSFRMSNLIARITKKSKFDIVYIHLFRMYNYAKYIPSSVYKITDLTDVVSKEMFRSIGYGYGVKEFFIKKEAMKIRNYERKVTKECDEVWVVSRQEKRDLSFATQVDGNIQIVGLGTNLLDITRKPVDYTVLFFGYSSTGHNRVALKYLRESILPVLKNKIPNIKLNVFGAGKWPTQKFKSNEFPVNHLGFVRDPREIFSSNSVMVAPIIFSAGTQTKILEAMSYGIPVITSDLGNEGIEAINGKQIIICNNADKYIEELYRLLTEKSFNKYIGANGQKFVREKFSWEYVTKRVNEIEKTLKSQNLKPNL